MKNYSLIGLVLTFFAVLILYYTEILSPPHVLVDETPFASAWWKILAYCILVAGSAMQCYGSILGRKDIQRLRNELESRITQLELKVTQLESTPEEMESVNSNG